MEQSGVGWEPEQRSLKGERKEWKDSSLFNRIKLTLLNICNRQPREDGF